MARNLRLIESLWRYGIGGDLARFRCNLTRSVYLTLARQNRVGISMASSNAICRIGVFYDGSFFAYAQYYYYQERDLGWLRYLPLHAFIEAFIAQKEQGYASYRVVYAAWHQGLFTSKKATPEQLRFDRNQHHDLMHAGVEARYLPMSQTQGEKGIDVALAVDALQDDQLRRRRPG